MKPLYKSIVCYDGFSMSVQASSGHYCAPKNDEGPYYSVEVSSDGSEPLLNVDSDCISGYVHAKVIMEVIVKHGGWKEGELPPLVLGGSCK